MIAGHILESNEFIRSYEPYDQNADVAGECNIVIELDTTITPELELEGYARDLVRIIQDMRKEANYDVADRISIALTGNVSDIQELYSEYILGETL